MTARLAKSIVAAVWIVSFLICCPPLWPQWEPSSASFQQPKLQQLPDKQTIMIKQTDFSNANPNAKNNNNSNPLILVDNKRVKRHTANAYEQNKLQMQMPAQNNNTTTTTLAESPIQNDTLATVAGAIASGKCVFTMNTQNLPC